jgi:hypothetical protein
MKGLLAAFSLLAVSMACGQPERMEVGGYVKSLTSWVTNADSVPHYDHLLHARLNTKWFPTDNLNGVMELRFRWYYGSSVEQTPDFARELGYDAGFGKLGTVLWEGQESVAYGEVDRLYVNWNPGHWQATLGRQRIAWGTNLVWNPIDVFNPYSVLDFDYEERPAADALRVQYYLGEISKVELAVKPGSRTVKSVTAAQWTTNKWDYDLHFLGGWRENNWLAGMGWAGDIGGGGFRGEALVSEIPEDLRLSGSGNVMISAALSGDYTFPSSFYIHTEALYNSEGVTENAALARPRAAALGLLSPGRWSLYQEFSYDVTPLVRASAFAIYNPDDHSAVVSPSATWSVITNLDLTLVALVFSGAPLTEYGGLGTITYLRLKWSF